MWGCLGGRDKSLGDWDEVESASRGWLCGLRFDQALGRLLQEPQLLGLKALEAAWFPGQVRRHSTALVEGVKVPLALAPR